MANRWGRLALVLLAPLFLFGCILTPGKFVSTLSIGKNRNFVFTYKGEVIAIDPTSEFTKGLNSKSTGSDDDSKESSKLADDAAEEPKSADKSEDIERKRRAIAEALTKEAGYRSVAYLGNGKFLIDYEAKGILTHSFVFPYNIDAEIIFPFVAIEVRANNTVRLNAPGFGNESSANNKSGLPGGGGEVSKQLDGEFTLDTDAEIVSQNNEDGATKKDGRSIIKWRATPLTKAAPSAVLRVAKLP
jgi:hypothetical protein